jgi:hypothetical protein
MAVFATAGSFLFATTAFSFFRAAAGAVFIVVLMDSAGGDLNLTF